jgi:hypothetical protein
MTTFPAVIFRYAWGFTLGILLINILMANRRARALVASGRLTDDERQDFIRGASMGSIGYCGVQTGIQLASHAVSPICLFSFPPHGPSGILSWAVSTGTTLLLLRWIWQGTGAETLARIAPAFLSQPYAGRQFTPKQVRLFLTGLMVLALAGTLVASRAMPEAVPPFCTATAAAATGA